MTSPVAVLSRLYKLEIPLPRNPLKAINAYVIIGQERNLLIDTGMNMPVCRQVLLDDLRRLEVDLNRTDIFLTHMHADHAGLAGELASPQTVVYCGAADTAILRSFLASPAHWEAMRRYAVRHGFPAVEAQDALAQHPGHVYSSSQAVNYRDVQDGEVIRAGGYTFRCVATPGHTPGHMCLYELAHQVLIAGDHVLEDITPNISLWSDAWDPLAAYLASLDRVYHLPVQLVLPGHRRVFSNHRECIRALKHHHRERLAEVLALVRQGRQTAYDIAAGMHWNMTYPSFAAFPAWQKWFALGEALAHLEYLQRRQLVWRQEQDGMFVFKARPERCC